MKSLEYELPSIGPVGLDLIALLNSSAATVRQIAAQARLEPVIFSRLIACANSPTYAGLDKSTDILASLVRLGQREIKRIVYQVVLRRAFYHDVPELNALLRRIWLQSLSANLFMQKFALAAPAVCLQDMKILEYLDCLGLVHNIGYVVLLANFEDRFLDFFRSCPTLPLPEFFEAERSWFSGHDHFSAGMSLLQEWNFPQPLWEVVGQYQTGSVNFVGSYPLLHGLLRLARHVISLMEYNFHPVIPADFWLDDTDLPAMEIDFEQLISEVRQSVQQIGGAFS